MVQVLVTHGEKAQLFECEQDTTIAELKAKVAAEMEGAPAIEAQEFVFAGEHCADERALKHFGVCENWIVQVTGFYINPREASRKFRDGELVPRSDAEPDWDCYPEATA